MTNTLYEIVFRYFRYENGGETLLDNPSFRFNELAKGEKINAKDIHNYQHNISAHERDNLTSAR